MGGLLNRLRGSRLAARLVVATASPASDYVTNQNILIDGGFSAW
jgi:hypothetical protein